MRYRIAWGCRIRFAAPVREHQVQIRLALWGNGSQSLLHLALAMESRAQPVGRLDGFGNT